MLTKHTPGPWAHRRPTGCVHSPHSPLGSGMIASVYGDDPECGEDVRQIANAQLISAAPEMLAALYACEEFLDNQADADGDSEGFTPNKAMSLLTEVRAAIAKATP